MASEDEPLERAKALALKLLAHRARSQEEVRRRLERKGFAAEVVGATLARLRELGYLDDGAYARSRAESLLARGRLAPAAVERRLSASGVAAPTARAAVDEARGERTERDLARACLEARRPALERGSPLAERIRAARFLAGRGFSEEVVREVVGLDEGPAEP